MKVTAALLLMLASTTASATQSVVLLHGLARSADSMDKMAAALAEAGYAPCNIGYPSRHHPVETLALEHVLPAIEACGATGPVHFVTHSLGGIVVRQLAATAPQLRFGRVVMLAPPNQGSEVVDTLGGLAPFQWINGPAGQQLGTDDASLPLTLGPAPFELGILTGNRSINLILSLLIPGEDDGKVSTARAQLEQMQDFLVVPASHPFIMKDAEAIRQTLHFLRHGTFDHSEKTAHASP